MFTMELRMNIMFWANNPISLKYVLFWCLFLQWHQTTYHSNTCIPVKKSNQIKLVHLKNPWQPIDLGPTKWELKATSHTSQEPWPWNCESPKERVQRPSQHTSNIMQCGHGPSSVAWSHLWPAPQPNAISMNLYLYGSSHMINWNKPTVVSVRSAKHSVKQTWTNSAFSTNESVWSVLVIGY